MKPETAVKVTAALDRARAALEDLMDITQSGVTGVTPDERTVSNLALNAFGSVTAAQQRLRGGDSGLARFEIEDIWARGWYTGMRRAKLTANVRRHRNDALSALRAARRSFSPMPPLLLAVMAGGTACFFYLVRKS